MTLQKPSQRRVAALGLITVIVIAGGSAMRSAVERELISAKTVIQFWAVASPFPSNREFYRLKAEHQQLQEDAQAVFINGADKAYPEAVKGLVQRQKALLETYGNFLTRHPHHVLGLADHSDLLAESGDRNGCLIALQKAAELSKRDVALWMELANRSVRLGDLRRAFPAFEHALELDPRELRLLRDYSSSLFVFRKDAMEYYSIDEAEVFDRSMKVLRHARDLYPKNMDLAVEFAMSHYSIKPERNADAIEAWQFVQQLSRSEFEKQAASLHIARFLIRRGELDQAGTVLASVTLPAHSIHKGRVNRLMADDDHSPGIDLPITKVGFETQ